MPSGPHLALSSRTDVAYSWATTPDKRFFSPYKPHFPNSDEKVPLLFGKKFRHSLQGGWEEWRIWERTWAVNKERMTANLMMP